MTVNQAMNKNVDKISLYVECLAQLSKYLIISCFKLLALLIIIRKKIITSDITFQTDIILKFCLLFDIFNKKLSSNIWTFIQFFFCYLITKYINNCLFFLKNIKEKNYKQMHLVYRQGFNTTLIFVLLIYNFLSKKTTQN